jgi:predicted RNA-binding Zn-ribbon protein involved in translation (DUF1610 family)
MLANSFLKTDALTCLQTIYTVITAVHMHENVGAAGIPFDESEAPIISVIFHDASRHFRLRSPDTSNWFVSRWLERTCDVRHSSTVWARTTCGMVVMTRGGEAMNEATPFACPTCGAEYKVARIEASPKPDEGQLICPSCGGPLNGREGRFVLKYFPVGGSKRYPLRPRKWRQG